MFLRISSVSDAVSSGKAMSITRKELFSLLKTHLNDELKITIDIVEKYVSEKLSRPFRLSDNVKKKQVLRNLQITLFVEGSIPQRKKICQQKFGMAE